MANSMKWYGELFLPSSIPSETEQDWRISPINAPDEILAKVPPALIATAEFDYLRDEGKAYVERLKKNGVQTEDVEMKGVGHVFVLLDGILEAGKTWNRLAVDFLKNAFER